MANVAQAKYLFALNRLSSFYHSANGMLRSALVNIEAREPLNNSLRTQRGLKGAAVVFCRDGQGGSLS